MPKQLSHFGYDINHPRVFSIDSLEMEVVQGPIRVCKGKFNGLEGFIDNSEGKKMRKKVPVILLFRKDYCHAYSTELHPDLLHIMSGEFQGKKFILWQEHKLTLNNSNGNSNQLTIFSQEENSG